MEHETCGTCNAPVFTPPLVTDPALACGQPIPGQHKVGDYVATCNRPTGHDGDHTHLIRQRVVTWPKTS